MKATTLNHMAFECYEIAKKAGWHEEPACECTGDFGVPDKGIPPAQPVGVDYDRLGARIALIHSEASEALEEVRKDNEATGHRTMQLYFIPDKDGNPKPEGVAAEFVDTIIRCLDEAAALGLDLDTAYDAKMAYNRTRSARHGGKQL